MVPEPRPDVCQAILNEAQEVITQLQGRGVFARMLSSGRDKNTLEKLTKRLDTAMQDLQTDLLAVRYSGTHLDSTTDLNAPPQDMALRNTTTALADAAKREREALEELSSRVTDKVGVDDDGQPNMANLSPDDMSDLVEDLPFDTEELKTELVAHLDELKAGQAQMLRGQDKIQSMLQEVRYRYRCAVIVETWRRAQGVVRTGKGSGGEDTEQHAHASIAELHRRWAPPRSVVRLLPSLRVAAAAYSDRPQRHRISPARLPQRRAVRAI
jgi:hypothetical protein